MNMESDTKLPNQIQPVSALGPNSQSTTKKSLPKSFLILELVLLLGIFGSVAYIVFIKNAATSPQIVSVPNVPRSPVSPSSKTVAPSQTTIKEDIISSQLVEATELKDQVNVETVQHELNAAPPTPPKPVPTPVPTPTPGLDKPGPISPESTVINSVRMYSGGKQILENGLIDPFTYPMYFLEVKSNSGDGQFTEPILFTSTWIVEGKEEVAAKHVITATGISGESLQYVYDPIAYPELQSVTKAQLQIKAEIFGSGGALPNLTKTISYQLEPQFNKPGTYSIVVSVASDRSAPEVLDRKVIIGAEVTLFDEKTHEKVKSLKTEGGVDIFRDLPAGSYIVQADYKGSGSYAVTVSTGPDQESPNGYVFLIVPIKPDKVDSYTADIYGQFVSPYHEFYQQGLMKNQSLTLLKVDKNGAKAIKSTVSDEWGTYTFKGVPGDALYRIDYTPPSGWSRPGDDNYNTFQVFSIKDRTEMVVLNMELPLK